MIFAAHCVACVAQQYPNIADAPKSTPAPVPTASPTPNPAMLAQARTCFSQLQSGKIDRSQMTAEMSTALTTDQVNAGRAALGSLGTPVTFEQQQAGMQGKLSYAIYLVTFGGGQKFDFLFVVDPQGKIAGLRLSPAQ